jgi:hypothetical protein
MAWYIDYKTHKTFMQVSTKQESCTEEMPDELGYHSVKNYQLMNPY